MEDPNYERQRRRADSFEEELRVGENNDLDADLKDKLSSVADSDNEVLEMRDPEYVEHK